MFEAIFTQDEGKKQIMVEREFNAPRQKVWQAWTTAELLDKWWAPKPWQAVTKKLDFTPGGEWLYYMQGPEGEKSWCIVEYKEITPQESFTATDAFCDENGIKNPQMPVMDWVNEFTDAGETTKVHVTITFPSLEAMQQITTMGFKEGFTMGLENLDELLTKMA